MQPKWDTLKKHEGRRKATRNMLAYNVKKGEWYMAKDSKHKKNMALFNARALDNVLQQLNQSNRLEREKKKSSSQPCSKLWLMVVLCWSMRVEQPCMIF